MSIANGLTLPVTITNGTTNDATQVMSDLNTLLNALNRALLDAGSGAGMNAFATQIHNLTDPSSAQDAATQNYVLTKFASPPALGSTTPAAVSATAVSATTVSATTLTTSGTVSGAGFTTLLAPYAPLASPALTGAPTAPTAAVGDSSTTVATTAFANNLHPPVGAFRSLKIATQGVANFTSVVTAGNVALYNNAGGYFTASSVNVSLSINTSGANGLDTGAVAASTWYYVYVIYNPTTTTTAGLFSLSSTAPTLPSGYTFFARVGAVRTDSSGSKYLLNTLQYGNEVTYIVTAGSNSTTIPIIASGVTGTYTSNVSVTYASVSVAALVPPTASHIHVRLNPNALNTGSAYTGIASSTAYGAGNSTSPGTISTDNTGQQAGPAAMMALESTSVGVYISAAGGAAFCRGWRDNL